MKLVMFSKELQDLSISELGERVKELGLDGVDLTVRDKGHVDPSRVGEDLPQAVAVLGAMGLDVPMITTDITGPASLHAEKIIAAAGTCQIREIKLGYWPYRYGDVEKQIVEVRRELEGLIALCRPLKIRVNLHIHSGDKLTCNPCVLRLLLQGLPSDSVGAYVDPAHMTLEGGVSGWKIGLDLLSKKIAIVALKSYAWFHEFDASDRNWVWRRKSVPLRMGIVKWAEVIEILTRYGFDGVMSLHSEYRGNGSFKDLGLEELLTQTREDLDFISPFLGRSAPQTGDITWAP